MAVNLGSEATRCIEELRGNHWFEDFTDALGLFVQTRIYQGLAGTPEQRLDQTSYCRGMFDIWEAIRAAYRGEPASKVAKPPIDKLRGRENAA